MSDAELSYLAAHRDDALCDIVQELGRSENSVRNMFSSPRLKHIGL